MDYDRLTHEVATCIIFRYAGHDRSMESAKKVVDKHGAEKAVKLADKEYNVLEKADRDPNFKWFDNG